MINHTAIQYALRDRAKSLQVATTGATLLSATAGGYARGDGGSFVTDGFEPGMEVTASGFATAANNGVGIVEQVAASALTIVGGRTAEAQAGARTLVVGLPGLRAWDNSAFKVVPGRPYIEEDFVPATQQLLGLVRGGVVEHTGLYVLRWYGLINLGIAGITRGVDGLLALFEPGSWLAAGNHTVRIRGDDAPARSRLTDDEPGWTVCTVTIPYRVLTINSAA